MHVDEHATNATRHAGRLFGAEIEAKVRRGGLELSQCARLELPYALAGDAELGPDLFERLGNGPREAEAKLEDVAHAIGEVLESGLQLGGPEHLGENEVGLI
jgi:hypothetical protein